ncbi:MAG: SpvB/TcaC N-terminal domain-containing protein [Pseudonocardia sp.]
MAQERRPEPDARPQPHRRETALLGGVGVPTVPALPLPTGGGAHRGVGEKFQVSPVTGTASVSVPIPLSPGRPGGTPELQLGYDSGHGNGVFGLGWTLGLPSVARRTDKRLPRYTDARVDGIEPDTYVLAGAEDLVPALVSDGADGLRVDERDDTDGGIAFRVRRYRPRIDAAFARIERWTAADRMTHWRVTDRENRTTVFGRTEDSRIADPSDPTRVFEWLPDRAVNDRGEVVSYGYVREDTLGVDPTDPAERHRLAGPAPANRLLKRIRYGHERPGVDGSWQLELVLDYGDHDPRDPRSAPDRPWPVRPDPFSSYRAGFEVRTWRRCARLLMFHRFVELDGTRLVRSLDLDYDRVDAARGSLLASATTVGWAPDPTGASGPPIAVPGATVRFDYRRPKIDPGVQMLNPDSARNLPVGLTGPYTLVDLDGEGLAGVLAESAGDWYYKPNLGGGRFGAATAVAPRPEPARLRSPALQQLLDLDGDGRVQLAEFRPELPGFFARADDGGWERFVPFDALPTLDWADGDLRFVDLDGDGRADVLLAEDQGYTWYASAGRAGFAGRQRVGAPSDDESGPPRGLRPAGAALQLADMSGDGLPDLVQVRAGEVCYWPNLGHGRFGPKVTMARAPTLDRPEGFDPGRVRLADVDGSGTTDLLYLHGDGVRLWINESGNGFGAEVGLPPLPHVTDLDDVRVVDLLGSGTGCLVWSTPLADEPGRALRYVELLPDGKPYLLTAMSDSLGARTTFDYTPSTAFYRADADAGQPWATRLPFPVQCLSRVELRDEASGTRLVSQYRYHHGYYDRAEREFRGFAYVEQTDAETLDPGPGHELDLPPVLTRRWFHTGPDPAHGDPMAPVREGWYRGDPDALELPPPAAPVAADPVTAREAARALRGQLLRTEVYALDAPSGEPGAPHLVTDHRCAVTLQQGRRADLGAGYAVFHTIEVDRVEHHYERQPTEPRVSHHLVLDTDEFGAVTAAADIAYPRRRGATDAIPEQDQPAVLASRRLLVNGTDGPAHRLGVLAEATTYELTGLPVGPGMPPPREALLAALDTAPRRDYLEPPAAGRVQRRAVEHVRVLYTDGAGPLPLGEIGAHALPYESYLLAFTPDVLGEVYGADLDLAVLGVDGGYVGSARELAAGRFPATDDPGWWWLPSGRPTYDPDRFFLPVGHDDPFGGHTAVEYGHALIPTAVTDPVGNRTQAAIDYRVLRPAGVTDPNGQTTTAAYDGLGRLVGTAQPGDSLAGFVADLPPDVIARHLRTPTENPGEILGAATTRVLYDLTSVPAVTATFTRERRGDRAARVQPVLTYTSGLGEELMRKLRAEPGPAPVRDVDGVLHVDRLQNVDPRWVGTGRVIRNNKGLPVRQYEPFFSDNPGYETEPQLVETGVTAVLRYDPLGRLVRTEHPDGSVDSVSFTTWHTATADRNDNVAGSRWLADRLDPGGPLAGDAAEQAAADAALAHADTPTVSHLDPLGRVVRTVADNGGGQRFTTTVQRDVEDNERAVVDARGITAVRSTFDLLGNPVRQISPDAGVRRSLPDAAGHPLLAWTPRGAVLRHRYDAARRLVAVVVTEQGGAPRVRERTVYGDEPGLPFTEDERRRRGLRGRVYEVFDGAGVVTTDEYDPVGNPRVVRRRFVVDPELPDWDAATGVSDEVFGTLTEYDVLHRMVREELPDGTVLRPGYNDAGLLERIDLALPNGRAERLVRNVDYDAKGQRTRLEHGNGAVTEYRYDPLTFRLRRLLTTRGTDALQALAYTYDPVGNVTGIADAARQAVFFRGTVAPASAGYTYDALYRLLSATGREHVGQAGAGSDDASARLRPHYDHSDAPRRMLAHRNDGRAMRPYTQSFDYDEVGNLTRLHHGAGPDGTWTRVHEHATDSNRLLTTSMPGNRPPGGYGYDAAGNMVTMPHLRRLDWDYADRLDSVELGAERVVRYRYDSSGQRARKIVLDHGKIVEDRRYLGGYEVYRRLNGTGVTLERHTVHVLDGSRRAASVETTTVDARNPAGVGEPMIRYQLDNHLGSACLELDADAAVLSYEEYYPYGATSYQAGPSVAEVSLKRYRYTGKERDEETGLGYHGARYYAPWLGRWTSSDPAGLVDGPNRYAYVRDNPIRLIDPSGRVIDDPRLVDVRERVSRLGERARAIGAAAEQLKRSIDANQASLARLSENPLLVREVMTIAGQIGAARSRLRELTAESQNLVRSVQNLGAEVSRLARTATADVPIGYRELDPTPLLRAEFESIRTTEIPRLLEGAREARRSVIEGLSQGAGPPRGGGRGGGGTPAGGAPPSGAAPTGSPPAAGAGSASSSPGRLARIGAALRGVYNRRGTILRAAGSSIAGLLIPAEITQTIRSGGHLALLGAAARFGVPRLVTAAGAVAAAKVTAVVGGSYLAADFIHTLIQGVGQSRIERFLGVNEPKITLDYFRE